MASSPSTSPASRDQILSELGASVAAAKRVLGAMDDAEGMFRVVRDGQEMMSLPRSGLARAIMLNHWYHHRGQLTVYFRMLDVPLRATYGASADENPMAHREVLAGAPAHEERR